MLPGPGDQGALQRLDRLVGRVDRVPDPQFEVGGDLVVARAGGVEAPRRRPDQLGQPVLDMHVDVLERRILRHAAGFIFVLDAVEPLLDRVGVLLGDDALGGEHRDMHARCFDVLPPEPLVEADRGIYLAHERRGALGEAPAPHGVGVLILAACDRLSPRPRARPRTGRMR